MIHQQQALKVKWMVIQQQQAEDHVNDDLPTENLSGQINDDIYQQQTLKVKSRMIYIKSAVWRSNQHDSPTANFNIKSTLSYQQQALNTKSTMIHLQQKVNTKSTMNYKYKRILLFIINV